MNVLSLFNGMSFGMMALETLGVEVGNYHSSEIDKYANQATNALYPEIIQMGDVTKWREWDIDWSSIDLLLAGFPCQAWSIAGKQKGDNDPRGALVHDLVDIWNHIKSLNPDMKFMFENVKMKKEFLNYINELFGVEPICINSALVSAQNRVRYYWTNIGEIQQPEDKGVVLADIIERDPDEKNFHSKNALDYMSRKVSGGRNHWDFGHHHDTADEKSKCITSNISKGVPYNMLIDRSDRLVFLGGLPGGLRLNDGKKLSRNYREGHRIYSIHGKSATLTAQSKGGPGGYSGLYGEPFIIQRPRGNNPGGLRAIDGKTPCLSANSWQENNHLVIKSGARRGRGDEVRVDDKSNCLLSGGHQSRWLAQDGVLFRKLTPKECMRLQTVPERHINTLLGAGISNTQLYKMTGNGWTHDVIVHIFKGL